MQQRLINIFNESKNFLSFSILKVIGQGIFYALPLILAKFISASEFGSFSLIQMVVMLIITILLTSSQTPFIVHATKETTLLGKINKAFTIQLLFFVLSLIIGIAGIIILKKILISFTGINAEYYYYIIYFLIGISLKIVFENIFIALNKKKTSALYSLAYGLLNVFAVSIISLIIGLSIHIVFLCYFISALICSIIFLNFIPLKKIFPLFLDKKLFKEVLTWTSWQIFGLLAIQLINWGDNIVLRCFVSFQELGDYNIAYQIFKGLIGMMFILNSYFLPFISKHKNNKQIIDNYLYNKRTKIFLLGIIGIFGLFLIAPRIFKFVYGDQYPNSIIVFQILLIGGIFHLYCVFYIPIINAFQKYKFAHINNIIIVLLNLSLDYLLIPSFGIIGAAIATVIAYFICLLNYEIFFRFFCKLQSNSRTQ